VTFSKMKVSTIATESDQQKLLPPGEKEKN